MKKSIKILFVGNSFSDNTSKFLYPILKAFGYKEVVVGNLYIGGCSLERHYNNILSDSHEYVYRKDNRGHIDNYYDKSINDGLLDEAWDFISMQQASHYSGKKETYKKYLDEIAKYLKEHALNKHVKLCFHMTWAYQANSDHPNFPDYHKNQTEMYNAICDAVKEEVLTKDYIYKVFPSGTIIQNARTSYLGDTLTIDGFHLDGLGEFMTGFGVARSIAGNSNFDIDEIPYEFRKYLRVTKEAVSNALINMFNVSNSKITKDKPFVNHQFKELIDCYYGTDKLQRLDMYVPDKFKKVVITYHGGGIVEGDKYDFNSREICLDLARHGIMAVSADYRMYPSAKFPEFIEDAASAVKYVFDYLKNNKINAQVYLTGNSAGAYLCMMLAFNQKYLANVGLKVSDIAGFLPESGQPTTHFNILKETGNDPRLLRVDEIAPIYFVNEKTSFNKMLLVAYKDDIEVRLAQNMMLRDEIFYFNKNANLKFMALYGSHCRLSGYYLRGRYPFTDLILEFIGE